MATALHYVTVSKKRDGFHVRLSGRLRLTWIQVVLLACFLGGTDTCQIVRT